MSLIRSPKLWTALFCSLALSLSACHKADDSGSSAPPTADTQNANRFSNKEVTEENYLSGRAFCDHYSKVTDTELGHRVEVPLHPSAPDSEKISIYYWLNKPFRSDLPTYVIIDGGPGQNTHGIKPMMSEWNEVHFDQRGLGCSAPDTFKIYKSNEIYSTDFTVSDMEAIRKDLGVSTWTVYGISYGTVPATVYGHRFPESTRAVVLEGTVYSGDDDIHSAAWKAKKLNLILNRLSPGAKAGFTKLMAGVLEDDKVGLALYALVSSAFYQEDSLDKLQKFIEKHIRSETDYDSDSIIGKSDEAETGDHPQQPFASDRQVHAVIFCRELGAEKHFGQFWYYSTNSKQFEVINESSVGEKFCDRVGLKGIADHKYDASHFPVSRPLTYLQGAHDGATQATGALKHWRNVPTGFNQMLFNKRGGHNPNLSDLYDFGSSDKSVSSSEKKRVENIRFYQTKVFNSALHGEPVKTADVDAVNSYTEKGQEWLLFKSPVADADLADYLSRFQTRN